MAWPVQSEQGKSGNAQEIARADYMGSRAGLKSLDFISNLMRTHWKALRKV